MATPKNEVIELVLTEHDLCTFALCAHDMDLTLNEWMLMAVRQHMGEYNVPENSDESASTK